MLWIKSLIIAVLCLLAIKQGVAKSAIPDDVHNNPGRLLKPSDGNVSCTGDLNIIITVHEWVIKSENVDTSEGLHIEGRPDCVIYYDNSIKEFSGVLSLTECFDLKSDDTYETFDAKLVGDTHLQQNGVIIRKNQLALEVICKYKRSEQVDATDITSSLGSATYMYKDEAMGTFQFTFNMYEDANITIPVGEKQISTEQMVYADIRLANVVGNELKMGVVDCFASPSAKKDADGILNRYYLIRNRCFTDDTVKTIVSTTSRYEYGFRSFEFTGDINSIYVHCTVALCMAEDNTGACEQPKVCSETPSNLRESREIHIEHSDTNRKGERIPRSPIENIGKDRMVREYPISSGKILVKSQDTKFSIKKLTGGASWTFIYLGTVFLILNVFLGIALILTRKCRCKENVYLKGTIYRDHLYHALPQ
ncbi:unnamed protein product [Owenia fusiformis]|uniref:Uncharacterized protein n=1 Tax=Owenia fusiformis TaxID=6347 RepID=A0A8J1U3J7_OWEFU|nr:unnamed protein product [Owenia fusiformis]